MPYVHCLRRVPQFPEKRNEQRDAAENAMGDDIPVTPDGRQETLTNTRQKTKTVVRNARRCPEAGGFPAFEARRMSKAHALHPVT